MSQARGGVAMWSVLLMARASSLRSVSSSLPRLARLRPSSALVTTAKRCASSQRPRPRGAQMNSMSVLGAGGLSGAESPTSRASPANGTSPRSGVHLIVQFDGGSRGNPGPSGCGVVVLDESTMEVIQEVSVWLEDPATNNEAEYYGALFGVRAAEKLAEKLPVERVTLQGDSQLVIRQIAGEYVVRSPSLAVLHKQVVDVLTRTFKDRYDVRHVMREHNSAADALANAAMDLQQSSVRTNRRFGAPLAPPSAAGEAEASPEAVQLAAAALDAAPLAGETAAAAVSRAEEMAANAAPKPSTGRRVRTQREPRRPRVRRSRSRGELSDGTLEERSTQPVAEVRPKQRSKQNAAALVTVSDWAALTLACIRKLRLAELQAVCKQRGLSTDGRVGDLRERLRAELSMAGHANPGALP